MNNGTAGGGAALASAKHRFSFNAFCNSIGFLTQIVSAFIVTPILVHGLGDARYGIWGFVGQTVSTMDLLDFGLGIAVDRFLARHHARDDREEMSRVLSTGLAMALVPLALAAAGGVGLALWAPHFSNFPVAYARETQITIVFIALSVGAMVPGSVLNSGLAALSRYDLLTLRNTVWIAVRALLYWIVLRAGFGLIAVAVVTLAVELAALAFGATLARRLLPWVRLRPRLVSRSTARSLLSFSTFAFLLMVASRMIFSCDNIVVGWALGPVAVAFYAIAGGLAEQLRQSTKILTRLYSVLATQIHALDDAAAMRQLFVTGSRLAMMMVLPGCIGLCLLGPQFLQLWLGPEFRAHSSGILVLLTVTVASFALATSCTQVLYGMNRHRYNAMLSLIEAGANLALSLILVRKMGAIGVAWGTAIPAVLIEAVVLPLFTLRQVCLAPAAYFSRTIVQPMLVGTPLIAWCWFWRASGWVEGWFSLIAVALAGLAIFALALRLYGIADEERAYLRRFLRRLPPRVLDLLLGA